MFDFINLCCCWIITEKARTDTSIYVKYFIYIMGGIIILSLHIKSEFHTLAKYDSFFLMFIL
jgi:hypothetical protein